MLGRHPNCQSVLQGAIPLMQQMASEVVWGVQHGERLFMASEVVRVVQYVESFIYGK